MGCMGAAQVRRQGAYFESRRRRDGVSGVLTAIQNVGSVCHVFKLHSTRLTIPLTAALAPLQSNEVYPPLCPSVLHSLSLSGG